MIDSDLIDQYRIEMMSFIDEYINLAHQLREQAINQQLASCWQEFDHGEHILFIHMETGQEVEVAADYDWNYYNLDPAFVARYFKTTARCESVNEVVLHNAYHDMDRILTHLVSR